MTEPATATSPDIVCHATKWYLWRRVVPMSILPLFFSAYFFYDWKIGYPAKKVEYDTFQQFKAENKNQEWLQFSKDKGWNEKPEEMDDRKINEQFVWGVGVGILGIFSLIYYTLSYPKKLVSDATSFTPPWGPRIPFGSVNKIDKRPWRHKGIAHVYHTVGGATKKAAIDDLRFQGADKILERLEANFTGEILDIAEETPEVEKEESKVASEEAASSGDSGGEKV